MEENRTAVTESAAKSIAVVQLREKYVYSLNNSSPRHETATPTPLRASSGHEWALQKLIDSRFDFRFPPSRLRTLCRRLAFNLCRQFQFYYKLLKDGTTAFGTNADRKISDWTPSLFCETRNSLFSFGMNAETIGVTAGGAGSDNNADDLVADATAKAHGGFLKVTADLTHLQRLTDSD